MTGPQGQPVFIRLGPPPEEPNAFVVEGAHDGCRGGHGVPRLKA